MSVRRWLPYVALVAATIALTVALVVFVRLSDNDSEFCKLNAQRLVDKQVQIVQTHEYLGTAAGRERTGLNDYIRITSLPRLREEVKSDFEALPPSCRDEYGALKHN